jgi:hypothetical protein
LLYTKVLHVMPKTKCNNLILWLSY